MLSDDYIVGLTDGEGSFTVYIRPPVEKHGAKNYRVECHYYIKLRDDNAPLIRKIKEFFKVGRVVFQRENRPNHHHCYRYEVTNLKEISEVIIPFFEEHSLQGNKIHDYRLFKTIVYAVMQKEHQTPSGLEAIQAIKRKMHMYGLAEYGKSVRSVSIQKVEVPV